MKVDKNLKRFTFKQLNYIMKDGVGSVSKGGDLNILPQVKALSVILLILLTSTFGLFCLGYYNVIPIGHKERFLIPSYSNGEEVRIFFEWVDGFFSLVLIGAIVLIGLFVFAGLYNLYEDLVDNFS